MNQDEKYALHRLRSGDRTYLYAMDQMIEYYLFGPMDEKNLEVNKIMKITKHSGLFAAAITALVVSHLVLIGLTAYCYNATSVLWGRALLMIVVVFTLVSLLKDGCFYYKKMKEAERFKVLYQLLHRYSHEVIVEAYCKAHPEDTYLFKNEEDE